MHPQRVSYRTMEVEMINRFLITVANTTPIRQREIPKHERPLGKKNVAQRLLNFGLSTHYTCTYQNAYCRGLLQDKGSFFLPKRRWKFGDPPCILIKCTQIFYLNFHFNIVSLACSYFLVCFKFHLLQRNLSSYSCVPFPRLR